jgi:glucan phosphoethanolaminetransferase (alkaline phosphatase superfamily)
MIRKIIYKSQEDPFSVIGIFIAVASIFISSWEILSQYDDMRQSVEVVFIKELPRFFKWFIPLFFGVFGLYLMLLFAPIKR